MYRLRFTCWMLGRWISYLLLSLLVACSPTTTKKPLAAKPEVLTSLKRYQKEYVLAPGDKLDVMVYRSPEFSRTVQIRFDGYISLPVLDDVKAEGLTVPQLDTRLTELYGQRLLHPEVTVDVINAREPMVYVSGEIGAPNPVPLRLARTAAEALAHAGGMLKTAARDRVAVVRLEADGRLVSHVVEDGGIGQPGFYMALHNMLLKPDDLIIVPESNRSQFVRMLDDFVTKPLTALNQALGPYFQFTLISSIEDNK
jgi:polysaccharide biosynthesis/export protein